MTHVSKKNLLFVAKHKKALQTVYFSFVEDRKPKSTFWWFLYLEIDLRLGISVLDFFTVV